MKSSKILTLAALMSATVAWAQPPEQPSSAAQAGGETADRPAPSVDNGASAPTLPAMADRTPGETAPQTSGGAVLPVAPSDDASFDERLELGYADAQHVMGRRYEQGDGVITDLQVAVEYYYNAASQGYPEAQNDLGRLYASGQGIRADVHVAFDWFLRAAEQGLADAQFNTALILHRGYLGEADADTAADWYWKAASQGHDGAIVNLSNMYQSGDGIERNLDYAYELLRDAAEQGNAAGQLNLARMLMFVDYAPPQDHDLVALLRSSSDRYAEEAGMLLGMALSEGIGAETDLAAAAAAYAVAADAGNTEAAYELGEMLLRGDGVPSDPVAAMARFQQAAVDDIPEAHFRLGALHARGIGVGPDVPPDMVAARKAYRVAAGAGLVPAQYNLGLLLGDTQVPELQTEALDWLSQAAAQDHVGAMYQLALAYQSGVGVAADHAAAAQWYDRAAEAGHASAQYNRALMLLDDADGKAGPDGERAVTLLEDAVVQDHTGATRVLAGLYAGGTLVALDQARARQLYATLVQAGDVEAQYQLARLYDKAQDGGADWSQARTLYRAAANAGSLPAQVDLALLLEAGDGAVPAEAVQLLNEAAAQDYPAAQYHLGRFFERGLGVSRDMDEATRLYILAAKSGDAQAQAALQRLALVLY